ncbi:MAG: NAD(P)/FAD-dependent oxidoreductase [Deltaproteobacteria bacterium]|nr:NAD(P)/FAD-dependent oxidoreductase [Deltaproteobacteria bacterium]
MSQPTRSSDVIVVGAGPAGSVAATMLARAGVRVTLLDRARFPRDKICGDAVGLDAVRILRRLDLVQSLHDAGAVPISETLITSPEGKRARFIAPPAPAYKRGFILPRMVLDLALAEAAVKAGATLIEEFKVQAPILEDGRVKGVEGITENGGTASFRAPVVIAADGAHSVLVRALGLRPARSGGRAFAVRAYYEGAEGLGSTLELHYIREILPAYGWIFPTGPSTANVGIGVWGGEGESKRLRALFDSFVNEHPASRERLGRARAVSPVRGWPLDLGNNAGRSSAAGLLVIGDAASFVDPITGEGIGTALVSAELAVHTALKILERGEFSERAFREYDRAWRRKLGWDFRGGVALQHLLARPRAVETVVGRAAKDEVIAAVLSSIVGGAIPKYIAFHPLVLARFAFGKRVPVPGPRRRRGAPSPRS